MSTVPELLRQRAELESRLTFIPYEGTVEIKSIEEGKYLYVRKRLAGKLTSQYVGKYSEELHTLLLRQVKMVRDLRKEIRLVDRQLAQAGYQKKPISQRVALNVDFARINVKSLIYDQAVLEGVATTFPQTETILENGKVTGISPSDIQKIVNLKHAWEFILDKSVIAAHSDYHILCHIARLVNEGFYESGGKPRSVPVTIGGTNYIPPIPMEPDVKDQIIALTTSANAPIDIAIDLCLYVMKTQIFNDGNKRTAVVFSNHFLIGRGKGLLVIPEREVETFRTHLIAYYEGKDDKIIKKFLREVCWRQF